MQREIISNALKFLISKIIPAVLLTLINIIFSRELSKTDYGSYQAIWTYLSICVVFTSFGLPAYILTYAGHLDRRSLQKALKVTVFIFIVALVPISVYLFFLESYFDFYSKILFLVLLLFQTIFFVQEVYLITNNQTNKLIRVNALYAMLLFGLNMYILFGIAFELQYCVAGITIISLVRNILLWTPFQFSAPNENGNDKREPGLSLLFWLGLNNSLQIITKWMDKLFLLFLLPAAEYAVYFNGTYELPLIGMLLAAFQSIVTLYSSKESLNENNVLNIFKETTLFMSGILFPLFALMFWYSESIVVFLFSSKYEDSGILFALSALLLPVRICSYTTLLQIKNKGRVILAGSILDFILSLILMFGFYPLLKLKGLVLALTIATYIQIIFYLIKTSKVFNISFWKLLPFKKLAFRLITVFFVLLLLKILSINLSPLISMLLAAFVTIALMLLYIKNTFEFGLRNWLRGRV